MNRAAEIAGFLAACGWESAVHEDMAADFSPRRYARLTQPDGRRAILMDADVNQNTPAFVGIARLLRDAGLSAPEVYAAQPRQGIVLLEDFGNRNVGRLMDEGAAAGAFYERAADVLARVHQAVVVPEALGLPVFNAALFAEQAGLFLTHYVPFAAGREVGEAEKNEFSAAWREALRAVEALPQSLMLRDFMPDNVMDLPERDGARAFGLLDFQDGGVGPIAYDIASFCEVVRRDGGDAMMERMLARYVGVRMLSDKPHGTSPPLTPPASGRGIVTAHAERGELNPVGMKRACVILSAQRHMRILGILAKQIAQGRSEKRAMLLRVQNRVRELMRADALLPVLEVAKNYFRD